MTPPAELGARYTVLGISGSLRKASFNSSLLQAAQDLAPPGLEMRIMSIASLPLFDEDLEAEGDPEAVVELKHAIRDADGVLFAAPEYNHGVSGGLKNAVDWASRDVRPGSLLGKPVTTIGTGGLAATSRAQLHLQSTLSAMGCLVMAKPGVFVPRPWDGKFDGKSALIDEEIKKNVRDHMHAFSLFIPAAKQLTSIYQTLFAE